MEKKYLDYSLEQLRAILAIPSPGGYTHKAGDFLIKELSALGYAPQKTNKGGVPVDLGGGSSAEDGLLLCCHIDTLGGIVSEVKENGRLKLSRVGLLSPNNTEGENLLVHTRDGKAYTGTFQLLSPCYHVNRDYEIQERTFDSMEVVIDEKTRSREETLALGIETGDFVSFDPRVTITESGFIKSRFLDDKLSSCILLAYAKELKDEKILPKRRVYIHFTVNEEVGHGASAYCPPGVTEVIGVDMGCVGEGLGCDETMVSICAKDTDGPSNYEVVDKLVKTAKKHNLRYAIDIYPFYVSDPDAVLKAGFDVRHCVVGAGVYSSHGYERSHIEGLINTFELVKSYIADN
jgi:putative aminopeptidase FrvX